jgi:hypothetical protein
VRSVADGVAESRRTQPRPVAFHSPPGAVTFLLILLRTPHYNRRGLKRLDCRRVGHAVATLGVLQLAKVFAQLA